MKIALVLTSAVFFLSCSSMEDTTNDKNIQIVYAGYTRWSEPPISGDIPEKGVDLVLTIKNWPEEATPQSIIYQNYRSFTPEITDTVDAGVVMNARIVKASSVLTQTSEEVDLSDRLVYTDKKGKTRFIEIEQWEQAEK